MGFTLRPLRGLVFPLLSLHFWERNTKCKPGHAQLKVTSYELPPRCRLATRDS